MAIADSHLFLIIFTAAFILDLFIGDPQYILHPVRIIGKYIVVLEALLRRMVSTEMQQRLAGLLLATIVVLTTFLTVFILQRWILYSLWGIYRILGIIFLVYLTSTTLATRELLAAGLLVIRSVEVGDIVLARKYLSMIVGRDVHGLMKDDILKAVIETLSENVSDGVIAPLFFLAIGGVPLGLAYKAINTLDSMVGYRNKKYLYFGWASARVDDIFNYIPARISGVLIALSSAVLFRSPSTLFLSAKTCWRDGNKHLSPNSGYPEAAIAGALGVKLGGPSQYSGVLVDKPFIGLQLHNDYLRAALDSIRIIRLTSFLGFILSLTALCIWTFT